MSSRGVPAHSGYQVVMGSSTDGMRPSSRAIPTRAEVMLLAMDQLATHESASASGAYHSATMSPSCTTTTPWVCRPSVKAYERASSRVASSMPCDPGSSTVHSAPGKVPGARVAVGLARRTGGGRGIRGRGRRGPAPRAGGAEHQERATHHRQPAPRPAHRRDAGPLASIGPHHREPS
ncbi:MAG: hypothetical protein U5R31_15300 [Acidimicrobiia bacterium]|nr:hypothetical protein [Acidimicrobiia bacterium]